MARSKGATPQQSGPRHAASEQLDGALKHAAHLRAQRAMYAGTKHGTEKSKRGPRVRVNPEITGPAGSASRGGRKRG